MKSSIKGLFFWIGLTLIMGCSNGDGGANKQELATVPDSEVVETTSLESTIGEPLPEVALDEVSDSLLVGTGSGGPKPQPQPKPGTGSVILGPVIKANVNFYHIDDLSNSICSTTTSDYLNEKIDNTAGSILSLKNCSIDPDALYLVVVSGGFDIDVDDDGIRNSLDADDDNDGILNKDEKDNSAVNEPKAINGKIRSLLLGYQLLEEGWTVSTVTEAVFQSLRFDIKSSASLESILETMDRLAPLMLDIDFNEDGNIDREDIILWRPDSDDLNLEINLPDLLEFVEGIHEGTNTTVRRVDPYSTLVKHIDTIAPANEVIIKDDVAYVSSNTALIFVDIKNKKHSKVIGKYSTGFIKDVVIGDGVAYIFLKSNSGEKVQIIDISNPSTPVFLMSTFLPEDGYFVNGSGLIEDNRFCFNYRRIPIQEELYAYSFLLASATSVGTPFKQELTCIEYLEGDLRVEKIEIPLSRFMIPRSTGTKTILKFIFDDLACRLPDDPERDELISRLNMTLKEYCSPEFLTGIKSHVQWYRLKGDELELVLTSKGHLSTNTTLQSEVFVVDQLMGDSVEDTKIELYHFDVDAVEDEPFFTLKKNAIRPLTASSIALEKYKTTLKNSPSIFEKIKSFFGILKSYSQIWCMGA